MRNRCLRFEALTPVLRLMTPFRLVDTYRRFGENCCLHIQGVRTSLKMEAAGPYETLAFIYQTIKMASHPASNLQEAFFVCVCVSPFPKTRWKRVYSALYSYYSILSDSFIGTVRLSIILSVCLSHPVNSCPLLFRLEP